MAITTASGSFALATSFKVVKANTSLNPTNSSQSFNTVLSFTSAGAGAGAFNEQYVAVRTLAGGATETLDLYGSLTNLVSETINFARIKYIGIELLTTTTATSITVGNAASNGFVGPFGAATHTITIRNGGFWGVGCADATGLGTVTNSSTDNLKIANNDGSNTATYRITLIGATS